MTDRIVLDMNPAEALFAYSALQEAARRAYQAWNRAIQTDAPADEQDIAKTSARMYSRLVTSVEEQLYPRCQALVDPDCDRSPVEGTRYCGLHTRVAVPA